MIMPLGQKKSAVYFIPPSTRSVRVLGSLLKESVAKKRLKFLPDLNSILVTRSLFLLLFWISHARTEYPKFPQSPVQGEIVAADSSQSEISGNQLIPFSWTMGKSSNNEPKWQQNKLPPR